MEGEAENADLEGGEVRYTNGEVQGLRVEKSLADARNDEFEG